MKELSRALKRESKVEKNPPPPPVPNDTGDHKRKEDADAEEYFGTAAKDFATLYPNERYPNEKLPEDNYANTGKNSFFKSSRGSSSAAKVNGSCPPPRVDRGKKPSRFRSAHERLFGRSSEKTAAKRDSFDDAPDYINTDDMAISMNKTVPEKAPSNVQQIEGHKRGPSYIDNSSLSSDSFNKYGSPNGTSVDAKNGHEKGSGNRHDPYRFTRSTAQPVTPTKSGSVDRKQHISSHHSASNSFNSPIAPSAKNMHYPPPPPQPLPYPSMNDGTNGSSPLKPPNYQSVYVTGSAGTYYTENNSSQLNVSRLNDGRPVPPPKPSHCPPRTNGWVESEYDQAPSGLNLPPPPPPHGSSIYGIPSKKPHPNLENGGPPGYFATSKDLQPPPTRVPKMPPPSVQELTYSSQTSFSTSAARR